MMSRGRPPASEQGRQVTLQADNGQGGLALDYPTYQLAYSPTSLNLPLAVRVFTLHGQRKLAIADTGNGLVRVVPVPSGPLRP